MDRRHFVKLSSAAAAGLLFSKLTYAEGSHSMMSGADEVWAQTSGDWFRLKSAGGNLFSANGVEVSLKTNGNAQGVYIQSTAPLSAVRLKWKHAMSSGTKILGDHWERTYGDVAWRAPSAGTKNPWYVLLHDDRQTACFGVKTGRNAICWWAVNPNSLELTLDTHSGGNGVYLGSRKLHAADIITTASRVMENPFATARRFCRLMCERSRLPKQPVYGINDWYFAYGNNSQKLIKEITQTMAELATDTSNRPFSVIDAGWAEYSPLLQGDASCWSDDFSKHNDKFTDMHVMAEEIVKLGMRPGIWTRALCAKHNDSQTLLAPKIKGRDDPKNPVLDPTIPENIERVKYNIETYKKWGYEMVKHDFSTYDITGRWGSEMTDSITPAGWSFHDKSKTNAEIINHLYHSIREAAGDMYIIGCNTMSHLSAGVFELNRIGDDTSGKEWARTLKMGVNTLGFRMPQHDIFYAADGDCVGLTNDVPWEKNKQWLQLLTESSAPLFVSPQPNALGAEQRAAIKHSFAQAARVQPIAEPLDWLINPRPAKWKLNNRVVDFDWG